MKLRLLPALLFLGIFFVYPLITFYFLLFIKHFSPPYLPLHSACLPLFSSPASTFVANLSCAR
jgi:hypothetical protein